LFWLVIHNSTIPIVQGGRANLYSVLTTFYLPPIAGYALAALIVVSLIVGKLRARKARQA
jgi:D-xylose transport system permease protein